MCARQRPGPRFDSVAVHERKFKKESPRWHGGEERISERKDTPMDESVRELTTKQAVEFLNHTVAKHTLENLRYTGGGPRFRKRGVKREGRKKDTRRVVYPIDDLTRWATENKLQYRTEAA